jgi:osmotically-inducible protein OsmY
VEKVNTLKDPKPASEAKKDGEEEDVPPPAEMKEEGPTEEEKKAQRELDRRNCNAAKSNLANLQSNPRIKMKGEDGKVGYIGDANRQKLINQARKQVRKYCK